MPLTKLLEVCYKHGILYKSSLENKFHFVKLGATGSLLQENLRNEWFQNTIINRDLSVFYNTTSFQETFNYAKNISNSYVPFSIAEIINNGDKENNVSDLQEENDAVKVKLVDNDIALRCTMFVSPLEATQYFHQWQRQRRAWWRKFSAMPGRYALTDIQTLENKTQKVTILAQYLWGKINLETITLFCNEHPSVSREDLQTKSGRKKITANFIISDVCQSTMVLNAIYDAFEEVTYQEKTRMLLRFHRKMAPYKISFAIAQSSKGITDELLQLALYLCKKLRALNISSLLLPSSSKLILDVQFQQYDELGVPYTVLLNEKTLQNGLVNLRSRDTTLKEQVHIADLPTYVEQLFKHY